MKRFWKIKNLVALFLAAVMLASPAVTALAQGITLKADNDTVNPGDQVQVTVKLDEEITNVTAGEVRVQYDEDLFTFDSTASKAGSSDIIINESNAKNGAESAYVPIGVFFAKGGTLSANQLLATLVFTAKQNITVQKLSKFTTSVYYMGQMDGTSLENTFTNNPISVTVTPASTEAKGYSMAVSGPASSVVVGEEAQVSLKITNSDPAVTTYNAYYAVVTYDSDSLTYTSSNLVADAVDSSTTGTLKIAGYGQDRTCGTDNINLIFKTKKVGSSNVTVASAKVDAKANASENDAPVATMTTSAATIKVTGYQVTLPDAFTGPTTVNPGENYTFTAKDTSKKYDFSGSTMGGKAVTIKDTGNGNYMVENVNGELVIKATEKVSKVKINLSGNAERTIKYKSWGDATEVNAGTKLTFRAMPDAGKELIVTVNNDVITGAIQGGRVLYTIDAEMVKGEKLDIVVNYKAEDAVIINETGDAWKDVLRNGWEQNGDTINVSEKTASLTYKPSDGKTAEDYIVTINGTEMTATETGRGNNKRYLVVFNLSNAVNGVITIDFSYKKTEPTYTVNVSKYLELDGQTMYLVTATGDVAEGKVLAYDGNQMYWSDEYNKENGGAYAWLLIPDETNGTKTPEDLKTEAVAAIKAVEGKKISIDYGGDVNLTKVVDINDAQFVWNMYNAEYKDDTTFQTVKRQKYLTADVNGDGKLNTTDAAAVVDIIKK